jgi:ABC-type transport system substrate-binding protein
LHDVLIKPLSGNAMGPCLPESWAESADGMSIELTLGEDLPLHSGNPLRGEDVKFGFEHYKGPSACG